MKKRTSPAATKADLDDAIGSLRQATKVDLDDAIGSLRQATKADLDDAIGSVRLDLQATKAELKGEIASVREATCRVAKELVATQAGLRELQETASTKADIDRVLSAIDAFAGKARTYDVAVVLHGQALTEVQVGMKDHERRLSTLEMPPHL